MHRSRSQSRGFTFVELMMGIIVTGMVLGALAVFIFGVADRWTNSETAQSVYLSGNMAVDRIQRALREASAVSCPTASDCIYYQDAAGTGQIALSEISLLEYDGASTINSYTLAPNNPLASTILSVLPTPAAFKSDGAIATPIAHNLTGCQFLQVAPASGEHTSVEVILNVGDGDARTVIYTTATLRCSNGSS